ncbi:MAG: class IV adenylate cyclase [Thermoprotei archaeon]|nr:MAG: class IV adenylate cyclase [Thermoprotei archaeon]
MIPCRCSLVLWHSMGYEVEAKFRLLCSTEELRKLLEQAGFKQIDECVETDTYYSHPCKDFKQTDEALRLRKRECRDKYTYVLTYKGPRLDKSSSTKVRLEREVEIADIRIANDILLQLGFRPISSFSKKRLIYAKSDTTVYLDQLYGVGWFVEIEGEEKRIYELKELMRNCLSPITETYLEICIRTGKCVEKRA